MILIDNAKQVLLKAWSVRLAILSAMFAVSEAVLPPKTFAILAALSACGTVIARVVAQPESMAK